MNKNRRPVLFGSAAVVALWSGWILLHSRAASDDTSTVVAAVEPARLPRAMSARADATAPTATVDAAPAPRGKLPDGARADAFAARAWLPPPPPPPPVVASPPPPPTLPYRFIGLLDEGRAGKPRVFLALGDKLIVADTGQVLEGGFRLDAISGQELVFTHMQQQTTLRMSVQ